MLGNLVWNLLRESAGRASGVVALRLRPESKFNIFAALDVATGHHFLVLKSNQADLRPLGALPAGRGFAVRFMNTAGDPEGVSSLEFELTDPGHADVFDVIGNDVLKNVVQSAGDQAAFNTFISRIGEWQLFLDELPQGGLSEPMQQGLIAELWFMHKFLIAQVGPLKAVNAWAGPKAFAKDFQLTGLAFEVKASSGKQHSRFRVNNELQLDATRVGRLILFCVLLEPLVAGGMSLPEMVSTIRMDLQLDREAMVLFSQLLLQCGYAESDAGRYTTRYAIRSEHFFDVKDDFPRIVESDLRKGVGDVHYSILYSECERYALKEDEAIGLMRATP
jgi:hypothetical protein